MKNKKKKAKPPIIIDTSPTTWQEELQIMAGLTELQIQHLEKNYTVSRK